MPELDFENIDFEKIPPPIQFGDIDFEGTGPIGLPEPPRKEPFLDKIKTEQEKFFDFQAGFPRIRPEEYPSEAKLIKDTAKAAIKVPSAVAGSLILFPGAGIRAAIELLPTISTDPDKKIDPGSVSKAAKMFEEIMSVPTRLITTEEEMKAVENIGLVLKPIEMSGEGWRLIGEAANKGLKKLGFEDTYIEPLFATYGEAAALFAIPGVIKGIKNSVAFRRMSVRQRALMVQSLAEAVQENPNMTQGQILRKYNNPEWRAEALRERRVGEVPPITPKEPVIPPIKPKPVPKKPKVETEIAKQFREVIAAERKAPPLTVLEAREVEIKKGEIDFEKVEVEELFDRDSAGDILVYQGRIEDQPIKSTHFTFDKKRAEGFAKAKTKEGKPIVDIYKAKDFPESTWVPEGKGFPVSIEEYAKTHQDLGYIRPEEIKPIRQVKLPPEKPEIPPRGEVKAEEVPEAPIEYYSYVGGYDGAIKIKGKWIAVKELNRIDKTGWERKTGPPSKNLEKALKAQKLQFANELFPELTIYPRKAKAVKKAPIIPDNDIITWIKATGGVREATLPGELKDLITDVDIKGKFKRAKGIPVGFLNKTTGRGFDEIVDEARSAGFDVRDESHLIELIERTQRAVMEGKLEEKVRPLTDETLTDKMWSDYMKGETDRGVSETEARESLEREVERKVTDEIAEEAEFARAEREAIQDEYRAVSEEVKPAEVPAKAKEQPVLISSKPQGSELFLEFDNRLGRKPTVDEIKAYIKEQGYDCEIVQFKGGAATVRDTTRFRIDVIDPKTDRLSPKAATELSEFFGGDFLTRPSRFKPKPAEQPSLIKEPAPWELKGERMPPKLRGREKLVPDDLLPLAKRLHEINAEKKPPDMAESTYSRAITDLSVTAAYKHFGLERLATNAKNVKEKLREYGFTGESPLFDLRKAYEQQTKKAVFPEEKITPPTKGKQEDFVKKQQKGDTIDLFSGFPLHKVDKAILEPLRNLYMKSIGDPLWNFLAETLPVEAGKRSRFVDAINKGLIWDYRKDPKFVDLRDDTHMRIQQYREKAKEIAEVMAKFSRAEQIRIAQIIKGGVTAAPKRYESAFEAIKRFQELQKDLQDLGILGPDNRFRQLTRKEIAAKFKEIKEFDVQIEKLRKRLQPIEKIGKVARSISESVSEEIVSTSETEGMYEVKETKWTGLNESRIKEALTSRGFGEGEATQMISRVKESVVPLEGKTGTLKEIRTNVEKVVTKTIIQEIIKTRTYHPAMMARARGSIVKDINKLANKRDEILERIRLHYKMSGKLYLRRAYEKIENEKTFLKGLINLLKIRKTRLKKGYEIKRKDLSPYYRETVLGEIKKAPYLVFKGLSEESHDVELMRMFTNIAKNKDWAISPEEWTNIQALKARHHLIPKYENFKPLPVTEKLGPLSGALVDPYIWDDLNEAVKIRNEMIKAWDAVLSLWKVGKAVYNPATQCRNILSNSILADFADLPQHRIDIYARAALEFYTKSGYWKEAKENTPLMGTEWAATEAMEFLKATSQLKEGSWLTESAKLVAKYLDKPGKMYQFWEQFFKLAVYTNERENGATIKAAYKKAEKYIFNYQKIPSAIRWAKRWWSPFITFSYKAIPRFAETVVRKPWKIAKYGLLMAAVEEITRRMLGESKEQMDREKRVLPDYMRKSILPGQLSHLRVFYRDKYGRSKYLDLSFILPWGDIAEQWGQSYLVGRPFLPNHPFYVFVAEVAFNEIFFTGQELTDKELDEGSPYWRKLGTQLWRQAMPSLAGSYGWNKLMAAYKGERDWALRDRSMTEAIFDVFFGLKIRSIDYNESHARRITQLRSKIDLAKQRFSKDYWKIVTNPTPDAEYDAKRQEKLYIRLNKDIDKIIEKITEIER